MGEWVDDTQQRTAGWGQTHCCCRGLSTSVHVMNALPSERPGHPLQCFLLQSLQSSLALSHKAPLLSAAVCHLCASALPQSSPHLYCYSSKILLSLIEATGNFGCRHTGFCHIAQALLSFPWECVFTNLLLCSDINCLSAK